MLIQLMSSLIIGITTSTDAEMSSENEIFGSYFKVPKPYIRLFFFVLLIMTYKLNLFSSLGWWGRGSSPLLFVIKYKI